MRASAIPHHRAVYDFLKHISTLASAALVLIATLIEKVFAQPVYRLAVGVAVVAFLLSLGASSMAYLVMVASYPKIGNTRMDRSDRRCFVVAATTALMSFLFGMIAISVFFAANWFHW